MSPVDLPLLKAFGSCWRLGWTILGVNSCLVLCGECERREWGKDGKSSICGVARGIYLY